MARVLKTFPGKDGLVRVFDIGEPIGMLCKSWSFTQVICSGYLAGSYTQSSAGLEDSRELAIS